MPPNRRIVRHRPRNGGLRRVGNIVAVANMAKQALHVVKQVSKLTKQSQATSNVRAANDMATKYGGSGVVEARKRKMTKSTKRKLRFAKKVQAANQLPVPVNIYNETQSAALGPTVTASTLNQQGTWGNLASSGTASLLWPGPKWHDESGAPAVPAYGISDIQARFGLAGVPTQNITRWYLKSTITHHEVMHCITNQTNVVSDIEVWEFAAAIDIVQRDYATPWNAWNALTSYAETDPVYSNSILIKDAHRQPLMCAGLGKYWKFLKKTSIVLEPGGYTWHKMNMRHKTLDPTKSTTTGTVSPGVQAAGFYYAEKGWTRGLIITSNFRSDLNTEVNPIKVTTTRTTHWKPIGQMEISNESVVAFQTNVPLG